MLLFTLAGKNRCMELIESGNAWVEQIKDYYGPDTIKWVLHYNYNKGRKQLAGDLVDWLCKNRIVEWEDISC